MQTNTDKNGNQLRSFGLTIGGIFGLIGFWPLIVRGQALRWWALFLAACLLIPAVVFPRSLFWVHKGWMQVGHVLGWVNTRLILGAVFYLVMTPFGLIRRWLGKDPMGCNLRPDLNTYRVERKPRLPSHLTRQY